MKTKRVREYKVIKKDIRYYRENKLEEREREGKQRILKRDEWGCLTAGERDGGEKMCV